MQTILLKLYYFLPILLSPMLACTPSPVIADSDTGVITETLTPNPNCETNGCLRVLNWVGDYSKETLESYLADGVTIQNGYSVYTLEYYSSESTVLATLTIPYESPPTLEGYGIVANAHGTVGVADLCALTGTLTGTGLAGLFGSRGFISIAPDYPGLGTPGPHPYLVAESEGKSTLDALRAAHQAAAFLEVPIFNRYAIVGLSQGGHAALTAAALHANYAPELDLRAVAVAGPATVWEEQWRQGAYDGPHLAYHALLFWSWSQVYAYDGPTIWSDNLAPTIDTLMEEKCLYHETLGNTLQPAIGETTTAIFSNAFLEAYTTGNWGNFAPFSDAFSLNRIGPYEQTAPLRIYQGANDDVVPEIHTQAVVEALIAGGVDVDYQIIPNGGHTDVAFGTVAYPQLRTEESISWVRERMNEENEFDN